jgi:hypothetical protein
MVSNNRKIFSVIFILVLTIGLAVQPANAAAPTSYQSGFQIRNLSSTTATVAIDFYQSDGTIVLSLSDTVAGNATNSYFPLTDSVLPGTGEPPNGFQGAIVISSDQPVASISNLVGNGPSGSPISYASYSAFSAGSPDVYLPLLMKGNFGYNTFLSVQNAGNASTNVTVNYSDGSTNSITDLKPGAAVKLDQALEAHTATVFSAHMTSSGSVPVVAVVVEVGPTTLFAYGGFGGGNTNLIMPLINENNFGYFSGVQIQNVGASSTDVTVAYTPGAGFPGTACQETRTVAAGKSVTFAQNVFTSSTDPATLISEDCAQGATFVGSGVVTANTASMPLVSVVNQLNIAANKGAAYDAFAPSQGQQKVVFPLIMDRNYGYFTSWSIVNVGSASITAASLVCTVTGKDKNGAAVSLNFSPSVDLGQGGNWTLNHLNLLANGFVGGATCLGPTGAQLVGTVNQLLSTGTIDSFLVYEGITVAP